MSDWIQETLYPNGTLINKLGIKDEAELTKKEFLITAERELFILQQKPKIEGISFLKKINYFLFNPLYDWAGEYRTGNFAKGNTVFLECSRFSYAEEDINHLLNLNKKKDILTARDYAELIDHLNYMHPFREGNGRSTRLFIQCLAANHNQVIEYPKNNDQMIKAENEADVEKISELIKVENI